MHKISWMLILWKTKIEYKIKIYHKNHQNNRNRWTINRQSFIDFEHTGLCWKDKYVTYLRHYGLVHIVFIYVHPFSFLTYLCKCKSLVSCNRIGVFHQKVGIGYFDNGWTYWVVLWFLGVFRYALSFCL